MYVNGVCSYRYLCRAYTCFPVCRVSIGLGIVQSWICAGLLTLPDPKGYFPPKKHPFGSIFRFLSKVSKFDGFVVHHASKEHHIHLGKKINEYKIAVQLIQLGYCKKRVQKIWFCKFDPCRRKIDWKNEAILTPNRNLSKCDQKLKEKPPIEICRRVKIQIEISKTN